MLSVCRGAICPFFSAISNGLKYLMACRTPIMIDAAAKYEDFITLAWPASLGKVHLTHREDVLRIGDPYDTFKSIDIADVRAQQERFCSGLDAELKWLQDNPDKAIEMAQRTSFAASSIGNVVSAAFDYLETALRKYASLQRFEVSNPPRGRLVEGLENGVKALRSSGSSAASKHAPKSNVAKTAATKHTPKANIAKTAATKHTPKANVAKTAATRWFGAMHPSHSKAAKRVKKSNAGAERHLRMKASKKLIDSTRDGTLFWLHIPKAGTSFGNALYHTRCPSTVAPTDLILEQRECWHEVLTMDQMQSKSDSQVEALAFRVSGRRCGHGAADFVFQHSKELKGCLNLFLSKTGNPASHDPVTLEYGSHVVSFLREPAERIVSAFHYGRFAQGMASKKQKEMLDQAHDIESFASWPGVANCQSKMILGHLCSSGHRPSVRDAFRAAHLVRTFAFVGITEAWDASIDLFHAIFGGASTPGEYTNMRATNYTPITTMDNRPASSPEQFWRSRYGKAGGELTGVVEHDEDILVFAAALTKFTEDCATHGIDLTRYGINDIALDYQPVVAQARKRLIARTEATRPLPRVKWLHVPKCGTSFANTLFHTACPSVPKNAALVSVVDCIKTTAGHEKLKEYERGSSRAKKRIIEDLKGAPHNVRCTDPAGRFAKEHKISTCGNGFSSKVGAHLPRLERHKGSVVVMLREPNERLVSAFMHNEGPFSPGRSDGKGSSMRGSVKGSIDKFVRWPGVTGCLTKMLTGQTCGSSQALTISDVNDAVEAVNQELFVGITEAWDASVDLFHAMFGEAALPFEYENVRPSLSAIQPESNCSAWRARYGTHCGTLQGHVDFPDQIVFLAALRRFAADCEIYGIHLENYGLGSLLIDYEKEVEQSDSILAKFYAVGDGKPLPKTW